MKVAVQVRCWSGFKLRINDTSSLTSPSLYTIFLCVRFEFEII